MRQDSHRLAPEAHSTADAGPCQCPQWHEPGRGCPSGGVDRAPVLARCGSALQCRGLGGVDAASGAPSDWDRAFVLVAGSLALVRTTELTRHPARSWFVLIVG